MKIACQACGARYVVPYDSKEWKALKIRCKKCGYSFVVEGPPKGEQGSAEQEVTPTDSVLSTTASAPLVPSEGSPTFPTPTPAPEVSPNPVVASALVPVPWTVQRKDEVVLQMSLEEIHHAWQEGLLDQESLCWRPGMNDWVALGVMPELQALCGALPLSIPPLASSPEKQPDALAFQNRMHAETKQIDLEAYSASLYPTSQLPTATVAPVSTRRRWIGPLVGGVVVLLLASGAGLFLGDHFSTTQQNKAQATPPPSAPQVTPTSAPTSLPPPPTPVTMLDAEVPDSATTQVTSQPTPLSSLPQTSSPSLAPLGAGSNTKSPTSILSVSSPGPSARRSEEHAPSNRPEVAPRALPAESAVRAIPAAVKPVPPPAESDLPPFDRQAAAKVLSGVSSSASNCAEIGGPTGTGHVNITFSSDGTVQHVAIDDPFTGTSVGRCILSLFRKAKIPPFGGTSITVGKKFTVTSSF